MQYSYSPLYGLLHILVVHSRIYKFRYRAPNTENFSATFAGSSFLDSFSMQILTFLSCRLSKHAKFAQIIKKPVQKSTFDELHERALNFCNLLIKTSFEVVQFLVESQLHRASQDIVKTNFSFFSFHFFTGEFLLPSLLYFTSFSISSK